MKSNYYKKTVKLVMLLVLFLMANTAIAQVYPEGIVAYWKFDEGTAVDSVGLYDGTVYGANYAKGQVNGALSFDGVNDYVAFSTHEFVNTSDSFSYSVWIKFNNDINGSCSGPTDEYDQMIVSIHDGPYLYLGTSGRMVAMAVRPDYSTMRLKTIRCSWSKDVWYHIAVTLDSSKMKIYVNGSLENEIPGGVKKQSGDSYHLKLGRMHYLNAYYFNGSIDELAVFNRALLPGEIQLHYQNGLKGLGYEHVPYSVYILSGGNTASDQAVADALTDRGYTPTIGVDINDWDGTQADLSDYGAVALLNNYNWAGSGMPDSGVEAIKAYVSGGGGLVTGEWLIWNIDSGGIYTGLDPVVPADEYEYVFGSPTTYTQVIPNPIINNGLPESFTFALENIKGTESILAAKSGATVFYSSSNTGHDGVIGWHYGSGRVISFSTLITHIELDNPNYQRLFVNATEWAVPIEPCEGDFDEDKDVDGSDLAVFAADFGRTNCNDPGALDCEGDFDTDGDVDDSDLARFAADFGSTDSPPPQTP